MKYNELSFGQMEAVVNKLGGMQGVRRFLNNELVVKERFPVWRTVKLGTGLKTANDFDVALDNGKYNVNTPALNILEHPDFKVAHKETSIDLVRVSSTELGFKGSVNREMIYTQAQKLGLKLCPAEVGPQLRLQYKDQLVGEELYIGMESIKDSGDFLDIFALFHFPLDGKVLWGYNGDWDSSQPNVYCVFCRQLLILKSAVN